MKNLPVKLKLFLSFGIVIVSIIALIVVVVISLFGISGEVESFYNEPFQNVQYTGKIQTGVQQIAKEALVSFSTDDLEVTKTRSDNAVKAYEEVVTNLELLNANTDDRTTAQINAAIATVDNMYNTSLKQVLEHAQANNNTEGTELFLSQTLVQMLDLNTQIDEIVQITNDIALETYQNVIETQNMALILSIFIGIFATVLAIIFAIVIASMLTKPIKELEKAAVHIAEGDLKKVRIDYHSKDELGNLAHSLRNASENMLLYVNGISDAMTEMASGNLSPEVENQVKSIDFKGDFVQIQTSIVTATIKQRDSMIQINDASEQVAAGSSQISDSSQALSQGATEQASSVEELAATIDEINVQVKKNAEDSRSANGKVEETVALIDESNKKMHEMIKAMADISDSSTEIGKIIKTIEDIAMQTNILSLNAAVEAARAGEAGKGFAVVAEEVRSLASKSAEASKDTSKLIERSISSVENGTHIANDTAESLKNAVTGANEINNIINAITAASEAQSVSVQQVATGIEQISSVVQTNSATAEECAAAGEELSSQSQQLKYLVSQFRID